MEELNKYRIVKELGNQKNRKFGRVYLVEHKQTKKKAILKHHVKNEDKLFLAECFRTESEFNFNFPGLPKTIYFTENEKELYLLNEYLNGIPLDIYWKSLKNGLRLQRLKAIFKGLEPIMLHLEQQKIVHCDLKPSNILIQDTEDGLSVSIIDFGMALQLPLETNRHLLFPLGYAAPELMLNELNLVDQRTDFYALGILIWRLYENKLPLIHPNPSIYTNLLINHPLPEGDEMPKDLFNLVQKMCSKHAFKIPPNQLRVEQRLSLLKTALERRPSKFPEILKELLEIKEKRWLFFW